jgi:hypothetical protein
MKRFSWGMASLVFALAQGIFIGKSQMIYTVLVWLQGICCGVVFFGNK